MIKQTINIYRTNIEENNVVGFMGKAKKREKQKSSTSDRFTFSAFNWTAFIFMKRLADRES